MIPIELNDTISSSSIKNISITSPLIVDSNRLYCKASLDISGSRKHFLSSFDLDKDTLQLLYELSDSITTITGYASKDNLKFYMLSYGETYGFLFSQGDSVFNLLPSPLGCSESQIVALAINGDHPELISIRDTLPRVFQKFSIGINDSSWTHKPIRTNPFFVNLSKPLGAFCNDDTWYFLAQSQYYLRDSLYVPLHPEKTNVLLFKYDFSYHYSDIIIDEQLGFDGQWFDMTCSNIIKEQRLISPQYTFQVQDIANIGQQPLHSIDSVQYINSFICKDNHIERLTQYSPPTSESIQSFFYIDNEDTIHFTFNVQDGFDRTIFSYNQEYDFAMTDRPFQSVFMLPSTEGYVFITDNGQFCKLDKQLTRIDERSFRSSLQEFFSHSIESALNNPKSFASYTIPVYFMLFPALIVIAFFMFFIKKVFFQPKRTYYSKRKSKTTRFSQFLFPVCLIYIIALIVFLPKFIFLLKLL